MKPIALDAMGGDHMPQAAVAGAAQAVKEGVPVLLVGQRAALEPELSRQGVSLPIHDAPEVIGMDEAATDVRRRKGSSPSKKRWSPSRSNWHWALGRQRRPLVR